MRILGDGSVEITNKDNGEVRSVKPEELSSYNPFLGVQYEYMTEAFRKEAEEKRKIRKEGAENTPVNVGGFLGGSSGGLGGDPNNPFSANTSVSGQLGGTGGQSGSVSGGADGYVTIGGQQWPAGSIVNTPGGSQAADGSAEVEAFLEGDKKPQGSGKGWQYDFAKSLFPWADQDAPKINELANQRIQAYSKPKLNLGYGMGESSGRPR